MVMKEIALWRQARKAAARLARDCRKLTRDNEVVRKIIFYRLDIADVSEATRKLPPALFKRF
jgi:hypothetical protein